MTALPEGISVYLNNLELKKNSLKKSLLMLAVEWKYLDEHLDLINERFNDRSTGLEVERKRLDSLRDSVIESDRELDVVRESLEARERQVECRVEKFLSLLKEFEIKKDQLTEIRMWVEGQMEELDLKNERINEQKESMELLLRKFETKKNEFEDIKKAAGEELNEIGLKEKNIDDRSKELHFIQDWIERRAKDLDSKEEEVEMREQQLKAMQQCFHDKSQQLKDEQKLFEERCKEIEAKEEQLEERFKHFDSMVQKFEERSNDLVLKEIKLEECRKELQSKEKQLEQQSKNFDLIKNQFELKQLLGKKGQERTKPDSDSDANKPTNNSDKCKSVSTSPFLSPLLANMDGNKLLVFLSKHVEVHKFMDQEVYVALRMSCDPGKLVLNATREFLSPVLMEVGSDIDLHALESCIFLLNILMSVKPLISSQVKEAAKRLAVDWKVNAGMREENSVLTLGLSRFVSAYGLTSSFDADEFLKIDKHIKNPQLNYALGCSKDKPVSNFPEYEKKMNQSSKDLQLGGLPDFVSCASDPTKLVLDAMEGCYYSKSGSLKIKKCEILKSLNFLLNRLLEISVEVTAQVKEKAMKIAVDWKAKMNSKGFYEIRCFLLFLATYKVTSSCDNGELLDLVEIVFARKTLKFAVSLLRLLGLEDEVPSFINILVERGMHLDAIKYVCAFELSNKFPPATLLKDHISYEKAAALKIRKEGCYSLKAKDNAARKELDALTAVVNCCMQYKLESQYPLENIEERIGQLKRWYNPKQDKRDNSQSKALYEKKRKGFVSEHANNVKFHPLSAKKLSRPTVSELPYQLPLSVYPSQSPPFLGPHESYYFSVPSRRDPVSMSRPSFPFGNDGDFDNPPNLGAWPGAPSRTCYLPPVRDQVHWQ